MRHVAHRRSSGLTAVEEILLLVGLATAVGLGARSLMTETLKVKYMGAVANATRAAGGPRQYEPYTIHIPNSISTQQSWSKTVQQADGSLRRDEKSSSTTDPGATEISAVDVQADDWWR